MSGLYNTADGRFMIRRGRTDRGFTGRWWSISPNPGGAPEGADNVELWLDGGLHDTQFLTRREALIALRAALDCELTISSCWTGRLGAVTVTDLSDANVWYRHADGTQRSLSRGDFLDAQRRVS